MNIRKDVDRWFEWGKIEGATFMIVAVDKTSFDYFPVYVYPDDLVGDRIQEIRGDPSLDAVECYKLDLDKQRQIDEWGTWHADGISPPADSLS